jgi:hypothetical protein
MERRLLIDAADDFRDRLCATHRAQRSLSSAIALPGWHSGFASRTQRFR